VRRVTATAGGLLLLAATVLLPATASPSLAAAPTSPPVVAPACPDRPADWPTEPPVLAHFYIWFTERSWDRAKQDFPAAGRYSSDDLAVVKKQVAQAQSAGIDGFIVSWKSTAALDSRLRQLRNVADSSGFKLAITYQAQDFYRQPLSVAQVRHDLQLLATTYAADPVFHLFGSRPVVALSGTWNYTAEELRSIVEPVASKLMVLATEKSVEDYQRVSSTVDGDLYYWSSADPLQTPGYQSKLVDMANAVRTRCGLWIAPVAPGFDARDVGGRTVVDRRHGDTLRSSWQAALASSPDAIGVISWNEFSENTYIEPSEQYGAAYLDEIDALTKAPPPPAKELDSSASDGQGAAPLFPPMLTAAATAIGIFLIATVWGMTRRRRAGHPQGTRRAQ
jgi:hypothetical protein